MDKTTQSTSVEPKPKKLQIDCKICGAPALNSYVGVLTCPSCKIFFRRNAKLNQGQSKCLYNDRCEININTRHSCSSCRLAKCFTCGMQIEMLRAARTRKNKTSQKGKTTKISTVSSKSKQKDPTEQFPTLNLLQSDQSALTMDEWNLLTNLTHCYDESNGFSLAQRFIQEQNGLPPKMRFRLAPVREFFTLIVHESQFLYEKNPDFIALCSHDRSILIQSTIKLVSGLGTSFVTRDTRLLNNPTFNESAETIYGSTVLVNSNRAIDLLDSDSTFVKLVLALLTFYTLDYTNVAPINLSNIEAVLRIQNIYSKLTWRYLLYKYGYDRAVICISNLIKCIFFVNDAVVKAVKIKLYTDMIDSLVKKTEETLTLSK